VTLSSSAAGSVRRGPGRPAAIDESAIARAVLDVGFRELTFSAVAERLGVGLATLYRHAGNRDELVRLGLDLAVRGEEWPGLDGEWSALLERWAVASWRAWERHPGAVAEVARGVIPSSIIALADRVAAALVDRGFSPRAAVLAVDLVFDLAADSRRGAEAFDMPLPEQAGGMRATVERQWREPLREGTAAQVRAEMVRAIRADPFEWFHGKLAVVLAGIAHDLAPVPRASAPIREETA